MKILKYKEIEFDNFTEDEYGTWGSICGECQQKYKNKISKEYEVQGDGGGVCSVKGCTNSDWDNPDIDVSYIDFDVNGVEIIDIIE